MEPLITMRELVETFDMNHVQHCQLSTRLGYRHKLQKYFGPLLPLPLSSINLRTVLAWYHDIKAHSETQAGACLSLLRTMFNKAIEWQMYTGPNPGAYIKRKHPSSRQRYVLAQERDHLIRVVERQPLTTRLYCYLVLFTGCRPGEAEKMRVGDLKEVKQGYLWRKPTTKNGEEQWVPLPDKLAELLRVHLAGLPSQTKWVFENPRRGRPYSAEYWCRQWAEIRRVAGLGPQQNEQGENIRGTAIRRHDLRRTCATGLQNDRSENRLNLLEISRGVLNHQNINTTRVYAIPDLDRIKAAYDAQMNQWLDRKEGGSPCPGGERS